MWWPTQAASSMLSGEPCGATRKAPGVSSIIEARHSPLLNPAIVDHERLATAGTKNSAFVARRNVATICQPISRATPSLISLPLMTSSAVASRLHRASAPTKWRRSGDSAPASATSPGGTTIGRTKTGEPSEQIDTQWVTLRPHMRKCHPGSPWGPFANSRELSRWSSNTFASSTSSSICWIADFLFLSPSTTHPDEIVALIAVDVPLARKPLQFGVAEQGFAGFGGFQDSVDAVVCGLVAVLFAPEHYV